MAAIFVAMYFFSFWTLDFKYLLEDRVINLNTEQIRGATVINTGIDFKGDTANMMEDDAYFVIRLPHAVQLSEIAFKLDGLSNEHDSKVYYSIDDEVMIPDQYWEFKAHNGEVTIENTLPSKITHIRIDAVTNQGETFELSDLELHISHNTRIRFYIFTLILLLVYSVTCFLIFGRWRIINWIRSNEKRTVFYEEADQIISLAISDFKAKYSGSYLGILWGIIQPLSTIILFWFVFQVGFRSGTIKGYPFILWLAAGMIPWNYFYDSWFGATNAFTNYGYIVKKVVFKIEYLPLVRVLSSTILNVIFNIILICIYSIYGHFMGVHIIDMIYFSVCLFVLTLGLSYITSTLNVFIKDIGQFMGIALQILMWMTPMMWQYNILPENLSWIYRYNPLHYVINGYRESLIQGYFFCHQWKQMIYFWVITLVILLLGWKLMNKLKDQFADVL